MDSSPIQDSWLLKWFWCHHSSCVLVQCIRWWDTDLFKRVVLLMSFCRNIGNHSWEGPLARNANVQWDYSMHFRFIGFASWCDSGNCNRSLMNGSTLVVTPMHIVHVTFCVFCPKSNISQKVCIELCRFSSYPSPEAVTSDVPSAGSSSASHHSFSAIMYSCASADVWQNEQNH